MPDVIVIGGGHNGLTAASYMARAGHSVTLFEATGSIGGMTATRALVPEAPNHLISPCAIDAVYWRASTVERDLELGRYGLRIIDHDPAWAWLGPNGESLLLARDVARTIAEIERFSTEDARTYREFAQTTAKMLALQDGFGAGSPNRPDRETLLAAVRGLANGKVRHLLGAALTTSAADLIESTFVSEQVRGAFAAMASILGSITVDSSGIGLLATAPLHRDGVARPVGGMQAIADSLSECLRAHGGTVQLSSPVDQILVSGGRARGVRLANGEEVIARMVIAAVPPQVTARLLAGSAVPGVEALGHAPSNSAGIGCLVIGMALRGTLNLGDHQRNRHDGVDLRKPTLFYGTLEHVLAGESQARVAQPVTDPPWTATILSATDPTQAPDGQDNLYLYAPTPVRPEGGWGATRASAEKELVGAVEKAVTGISELEIGRWVETPEDLEHRLGAANGCIYHVDQVVTRLGPLRPARGWGKHATDVPGLVLSGAGTHPGGGVSGIPGQLAARAALRSMN
ncbi:Phytoene desaturase (neurosporene-forming) [Nocardia cerradoensis]|uniref:Pyridine nucleotide-disulfide oxidoreductase domain-containing protein 2 n=1 Tax=Nocardia cerradoensis TaxID=85688 RepID=A0A231H8K0_9NOCA|nr:NAD(P)/FAD-dependent oxidoreductase [Nocardia cerradoensis]OXR45168.1 Phytoene desaturase (neurosporene-forming) [Nocardia cerradoensis]